MTSRLRRMLLINTRTSGNHTSASINEVDPRGGASITGENAVGKTTTLELFPLFFGTLPSKITETVGGREPMLKFVLPMPYSAIVFEYQRGNDEAHDVRCAVLRRTDNDHRPVYRFINTGFREEAFLRTNEAGQAIFCDDKQMVDAYISMGAECSRLLDIAEYRAVILGTEARTHDAKTLRRLSAVYGLGSRLTNLDRLIAAVAKDRLDFKDFVHLAVTIVQERLNTHGDAPSRQKVTLRQSKDQIDRWLRDRTALEIAFGLTKDVDLLREAIDQYSKAESALRAARLDVAPMLKLRRDRLVATQDSAKLARRELSNHNAGAQERVQTLMKAAEDAASTWETSINKVRAEEARRSSLHLSQVQGWASALERVAQMQVNHRNLLSSAEVMTGKSSDIVNRFSTLINDARTAASDAANHLRSSKDQLRAQAEDEAEAIREIYRAQDREFDAKFRAVKEELEPQIQELLESKAMLEAKIGAAQPSQAALEQVKAARNAVRNADQKVLHATRHVVDTKTAWTKALQSHRDAESAVDRAVTRVEEAESRVNEARTRLTPPDGSLLSVLRASDEESWRSDLAKMLDPSLLARTDLSPTHNPSADPGTAFGWQLNTSNVPQPDWADDEQLRQALAQADSTLLATKQRLNDANEILQDAAEAVRSTKRALDEAEGALSTAGHHQEKARHDEETAEAQCEFEMAELKRNGDARLQVLINTLRDLRRQLSAEEAHLQSARANSASEQMEKLRHHKSALNQAIDAIEQQATEALAKGEISARSLVVDRDAALKKEGVDPIRLSAIHTEATALEKAINVILGFRPNVELWRQWLTEGGEQILASLSLVASNAETANVKAQDALSTYRKEAKQEQDRLADEVDRLEKVERKLLEEIEILQGIVSEHGLSELTTREADPVLSLEDLRTRLNQIKTQLADGEVQVNRRHGPIRDQLIGRSSSVADYVQGSLDALPGGMSSVGKAAELCFIYDGLKRQVLPNVINDVTTILNQVRQFRSVVTRFESEVNRFNNELQRGLNVAQFHRIESLKVAIVSNFGELSLMREIDEIDKVARAHETSLVVNDRAQLPDAHTARALTKFLQLLRQDSTVELDLAAHVDLKGSVTVNGQTRPFSRPADLEHISSTGINAIILISLLVGMLNMIRGDNDTYIPWISDEVGKFDPGNFKALMDTLRENRIDPVTASPTLTHAEFRHFARRYVFKDRGSIGLFAPLARSDRRSIAIEKLKTTEASLEAANET